MSITIHHGPNGSYKTSGVVQDFFIPAALEGRTVVTNIRGISSENTYEQLEDTAQGFEVIFIDSGTSEGRQKLLTWWHWCPIGALLLFDEAGVIFPKSLKPADIEKLSYLGGVDEAEKAGRPCAWVEAWEMHRHYNWDIVLSCPNIKSVRDDIRNTTEGAYKHKNMATMGAMFKGKYKEGFHSAADNGSSPSQFTYVKDKRIKPITFKLYGSTKTGETKDTLNAENIFMQWKILFPLGVAAACIVYSLTSGGLDFLSNPKGSQPAAASVPASRQMPAVPDDGGSASSVGSAVRNVVSFDGGQDAIPVVTHPIQHQTAQIIGSVQNHATGKIVYWFSFAMDKRKTRMSNRDLNSLGYKVTPIADCLAQVTFKNQNYDISCLPSRVI